MRRIYQCFICFLVMTSVLNISMSMAADQGAKNKGVTWKKNVKAGDCVACHGKKKKLPESHISTKDMTLASCKQCHAEQKIKLAGKLLMSHFHSLSGLTCSDCHEKNKKPDSESVTTAKCLLCHKNYEHLASLTDKVDPNPHKSHLGPIDCNNCHNQHKPSTNFCGQCHSWPLDVP